MRIKTVGRQNIQVSYHSPSTAAMRIIITSWVFIHVFQSIAGKVALRLAPLAEEASAEQFPYQASIRIKGNHTCGGSLISTLHVLTAAHCIHKLIENPWLLRQNRVTVGVGSARLNEGDEYSVRRLSEYRGYVGDSSKYVVPNDIAVITLRDPVSVSEEVSPIDLPQSSLELPAGTKVVVSGFGNEYKDGPASLVLKQAPMKIVSREACTRDFLYKLGKKVAETQICAKFRKYAGTCQGDSGGPLVYRGKDGNVVVGVVSAGVEKCGDGTPDTYTKVSSFLQYIEYEMNYDTRNEGDWRRQISRAVNLGSSSPTTSPTMENTYSRKPKKIKLGGLFDHDSHDLFNEILSDFGLRLTRRSFSL